LQSQSRKQWRGIVYLGGQIGGMEQHWPDVAAQFRHLGQAQYPTCEGITNALVGGCLNLRHFGQDTGAEVCQLPVLWLTAYPKSEFVHDFLSKAERECGCCSLIHAWTSI
jgi:hypothetical protein